MIGKVGNDGKSLPRASERGGGKSLPRASKRGDRKSGRAVRWRSLVVRALVFLPALTAFPAFPALSQTEPRLVEAIRQAQEGRGDSARTKVRRLLAATSPTDTLYPQIIYTQAMVAWTDC